MPASPAVLTQLWPLTGRHEDLEAIIGALVDGSRAQVIVGDAGTGKTRLAREVLRRLADDGVPTAGATASESAAATPLGALAHLVPPGALDSPSSVFSATREAMVERTGGRALVLHVDDAHLLDASSAALLVGLAEAGVAQLVLTMRPGHRGPDALGALRAADGVGTTTLGALDAVAIDTLLHRVLGGPLDGVAEAQLLHTSGGNPLYLRELVLGAVQDGSLREVDGVWRLDGGFPAAEALGDRVLGRMADLPTAEREALELVAVAEPIGLDLLEGLVDPDVLEGLEQRALLRVEASRRRHEVRLAHPVYGEILRGSIGRVRLRRLSRTLVEAVTATGLRRGRRHPPRALADRRRDPARPRGRARRAPPRPPPPGLVDRRHPRLRRPGGRARRRGGLARRGPRRARRVRRGRRGGRSRPRRARGPRRGGHRPAPPGAPRPCSSAVTTPREPSTRWRRCCRPCATRSSASSSPSPRPPSSPGRGGSGRPPS
ncbi:MAG: AAA family ATPase [Acidimicrobiales bacterium]